MLKTKEVISKMPNIEYLHLVDTILSKGFLLPIPGGPNPHTKLLPSLRRLCLENVEATNDDWGPLVTYMAHLTYGDQAVSLNVFGDRVHICTNVLDQLYLFVKGLLTYIADPEKECPFYCDDCLLSV